MGGASLLKKLFGFIYLRAASYFSEWRLERASGSSKVLGDYFGVPSSCGKISVAFDVRVILFACDVVDKLQNNFKVSQ